MLRSQELGLTALANQVGGGEPEKPKREKKPRAAKPQTSSDEQLEVRKSSRERAKVGEASRLTPPNALVKQEGVRGRGCARVSAPVCRVHADVL